MNYYERYMGDYQRDTGHLSMAEHGAYTILLDTYYSTEKPLPGDMDRIYRLCRAMTKDEQAAVRSVIDQFFPVSEDGQRHNFRADVEITHARPKMEAARANGKKGGRPRKNEKEKTQQKPSGFSEKTQQEPSSNPAVTQEEPKTKAPQPHTPTPKGIKEKEGGEVGVFVARDTPQKGPTDPGSTPEAKAAPTLAGAACLAMRQAGMASVNPSHPTLLAMLQAGITPEELASAAAEAVSRNKPFAYALKTAEGRHRDAAGVAQNLGTSQPRKPSSHHGFDQLDYREGVSPDGRF